MTIIYHPDRNDAKDANEKFNTLKQAYDILSSKNLRKGYSKYLQHLQEAAMDKEKMSERRKKFAEDLKRREKNYFDSRHNKS